MIPVRTRLLRTAGVAALLLGCHDTVGVSPADVAGVYDLRSVVGTIGTFETPVSGQITLTPTRAAERRLNYQIDTIGTVRELVARGTYQLANSRVELALRGDDGRSAFVWRVDAELLPDGGLRLTYPRPADGTIVELYRRRTQN